MIDLGDETLIYELLAAIVYEKTGELIKNGDPREVWEASIKKAIKVMISK